MVIEEGQTERHHPPRTWLVVGLLTIATLGLGGTYARSVAGDPGQGASVGIQYIADLTVTASGGDLSVTMPFNSSPLKNDDGSVAVGVRMVMTVTKPDASTVTFRQTTDGDGRIRGQIYGSVVNQVGTYTLTVAVDGGGPSAATPFTIAERAQLDRDSQVFTGNNQVFRNDADSTTAFSVQNALGAAILNVDTTNSEVEVVNLIASGTISGDGSGLTTLNASNIASGTLADARLSANVTVQGNTFNGANQLVKLTAGGLLPVLNGSNLTAVDADLLDGQTGTYYTNASNLASGTLADARLSANVALLDRNSQTFTGNDALFKNAIDSTTAFRIQNAAGTQTLLAADTTANKVVVTNIEGAGAGLTSLNASNVSSGTLADARLSANVTLQGNTFNGANQLVKLTAGGLLPVLNGSNLTAVDADLLDGQTGTYYTNASNLASGTLADARFSANVALLDRNSQTFTGNDALFKNAIDSTTAFRIQNAAGTQTLMAADTTANKIVVTNIEGAGAGLTSLNASNLSSGTLADARLSANVTTQGNTFNGVSQLVQLDVGGALPAVSGAALTSLNASNVSSGTLADARLSANVTVQGNTFNGVSQLVQTTAGGALPALSGTNVTSLNASNVSSGTLADGRLSANVALLDRNSQTFTGNDALFKNAIDSTTAFRIQNAAGIQTLLAADTTANKVVVTNIEGAGAGLTSLNASNVSSGTLADARLSANVTVQGNTFNGASQLVQLDVGGALPAVSGTALTSLNASNISSGTLADGRLSGNVALLNGTGPQTFTGNDKFTGTFLAQNAADSTAALQVQNAAGTSNLFVADTTNTRVAVGALPATSLLTVGTNTTTAAGGLTFGTDTNLYRSAADTLKTDDALTIAGELTLQPTSRAINSSGYIDITRATASSGALRTFVTGDTTERLQIRQDGQLLWGPGNAAADTNLYRSAADTLKTDDKVVAGATSSGRDQITIPDTTAGAGLTIGGDTNLYRSAANTLMTDDLLVVAGGVGATSNWAFSAYQTGDVGNRWNARNTGVLEWGPGNVGIDTNLYRGAADVLQTDDRFIVQAAPGGSGGNAFTIRNSGSNALNITNGGLISWADGAGGGLDTNLYRSGANVLRTDDTFQVSNGTQSVTTYPDGNGILSVNLSTNPLIRNFLVSGDTQPAVQIYGSGKINWGAGGASVADTTLYRSAADTLKTDDAFISTGSSATAASFNRLTTDGTIVSLQQDSVEEGTISVSGTTVSYNAFTGSHYADAQEPIERGMLVTMTGQNGRLNDRPDSEVLYGVKKSAVANDPKIMGSYLSLLNPKEPDNKDKPETSSNPSLVEAVGNGEIWVVDNGKNLETSDYLVSSDVSGHAVADTGGFPVSHVVAKVAEGVDWSKVSETVGGRKHKKVSVFFTQFEKQNQVQGNDTFSGFDLNYGAKKEVAELSVTEHLITRSLLVTGAAEVQGDLKVAGTVTLADGDKGVNVKVDKDAKKIQLKFKDKQPDDHYIVQVEQSWLTNHAIIEKTAEGFTIEFDKAAPENATFDWFLVR